MMTVYYCVLCAEAGATPWRTGPGDHVHGPYDPPAKDTPAPATLEAAVASVVAALTNPGAHPEWHALIQQKHAEEWPTLWKALKALLAAHQAAPAPRCGAECPDGYGLPGDSMAPCHLPAGHADEHEGLHRCCYGSWPLNPEA